MVNNPVIQAIGSGNVAAIAGHAPVAGSVVGPIVSAAGFADFYNLVRDEQPFDIKRTMGREFNKDRVKLGNYWYEFSTPGNIAYGFYGAAAGYNKPVLHVGAGIAQSGVKSAAGRECGIAALM